MPRLPRVVELRQVSQFLSGGVQGWVPLMGDTEQVFTNVVDFLAQTQEERSIWQLGLSESATKRCVSLQELSGQPAFDLWPRTPPWILSYCRNSFARPSKTSSLSALCSMIFCTCSTKRTWKSRKLDAWVLEIPFGKPFVQPIDLRQPYYTYIYIYTIYILYIYYIYTIYILYTVYIYIYMHDYMPENGYFSLFLLINSPIVSAITWQKSRSRGPCYASGVPRLHVEGCPSPSAHCARTLRGSASHPAQDAPEIVGDWAQELQFLLGNMVIHLDGIWMEWGTLFSEPFNQNLVFPWRSNFIFRSDEKQVIS